MKKLLTFCCAVALVLSALAISQVKSLAASYTQAEESAVLGEISVELGQVARKDERQDHLEIPLKLTGCSFDAKALGNTQVVTNQFEKISLYTTLGVNGTDYGWYTLGELNQKKNNANMPYVVRTAQHGSTLFIAMDCFWGGDKDLLPEYVKAVKIEAGMTMAVHTEDHFSWDSGDTIPSTYTVSKECTKEDIIIERVAASEADKTEKKNDTYRIPSAAEVDILSFKLKDWHYGLNTRLSETDIESAEVLLNSLGGARMTIDDLSAITLDYDFSETNIASPVKATYGLAVGTETVYCADITGELILETNKESGKVDGRLDHLEINFVAKTFTGEDSDWAMRALGNTQAATNQFDKISLYASIGEGTEYNWYTLRELNGMKNNEGMPYVVRCKQFGNALFIDMDCYYRGNKDFLPANVKAVLVEKGFVFATYTGDHWSWNGGDNVPDSYGMATQTPLMEDVLVEIEHKAIEGSKEKNDVYKIPEIEEGDELTVLSPPTKTEYEVNEPFSGKGVRIEATYNSLGGKTVIFDGATLDYTYDFSEAGNKTVTGTFGGRTFEISVQVVKSILSIAIGTQPAKITYGLGEKVDFSGLVVKVNMAGGESYDAESELLTFTDPDMFTVGKKTVTVAYRGFEATFDITVEDKTPDSYMDFYAGSPVTFTDQFGCMALRFDFHNIQWFNDASKALYQVDNCNNGLDRIHLKISDHYTGGKLTVGEWYTVRELMETKDSRGTRYIQRLSQFGETLLFHLDTYMGDGATKEFIVDDVAAIKVDAGFFFVDYYNATWGENNIKDYWVLENAILRHDLLVEMNVLGIAWIRPFAEEGGLTIKSLPDKIVYGVDDKLDTTGLVIHCKYADGYEEDVAVDVKYCKYDFSETGEKTVTVTYNESKVQFTVTVNEGVEDSSHDNSVGNGCGSNINSGALFAATALLMLAGIVCFAKRKQN